MAERTTPMDEPRPAPLISVALISVGLGTSVLTGCAASTNAAEPATVPVYEPVVVGVLEQPATPSGPTPPAAPVAARRDGGPFVFFLRPSEAGIDWRFESSLPLVSASGETVFIARDKEPVTLSSVLNLELVVLRVKDGAEVLSLSVLDAKEWRDVFLAEGGPDRARVKALGAAVVERITRGNAGLSASTPVAPEPCVVEPTIGASSTACDMQEQRGTCGALSISFRPPSQLLSVTGGRTPLVGKHPGWQAPAVPGPGDGVPVPVRGCIGAAWHTDRVLILRVDQACQSGGDGCGAPARWRVVPLP
jgi:hypothetical protein